MLSCYDPHLLWPTLFCLFLPCVLFQSSSTGTLSNSRGIAFSQREFLCRALCVDPLNGCTSQRRLNPLCEIAHGGSDSARQDAEPNTEEIDCCMWAVSRVPTSEEDVTLEVEGWQNNNHKLSLNRENQVIRYRNRKDRFLSGIHCNFYMHIKQFNHSLLCSGLKKLCTEGQKNCMNLISWAAVEVYVMSRREIYESHLWAGCKSAKTDCPHIIQVYCLNHLNWRKKLNVRDRKNFRFFNASRFSLEWFCLDADKLLIGI